MDSSKPQPLSGQVQTKKAPASTDDAQAQIPLTRPVLEALAAAVLVFVLFEIVEWLLFGDIDMRATHLLHRGREFTTAIVVAMVAGRSAFKASPRLLATPLSATGGIRNMSHWGKSPHGAYVQWFILMRWIAVAAAAFLVFIAVEIVAWLPKEVWYPLMGAIAGLAVLNAIYTMLLQQGVDRRLLLAGQAYADLLVLTVLLHFSGGVENPLGLLMIFHVIIGGIVLSRRQCFLITGTAAVLFATLAGAEFSGIIDHYTLHVFPHIEDHGIISHAAHDGLFVGSYAGLQAGILLLTAVFVTSLAERLRWDEQQLEEMAATELTQRQMLEQALETTGTSLCVCDRQLQPLRNNEDNHTCRELIGSDLPWPIPNAERPARLTLQDGTVRVTEATLNAAGEVSPSDAGPDQITIELTTAPLRDKDGHITHVVQLFRDVTEQKAAQARILRAGQLAAVGELAGQVAHEVNNPIGIINAKLRLLLSDHREGMSDKLIEELKKMVSLSDRVAQVAQRLLSYCRPKPEERTWIDMAMSVRRALSMVEQRAGLCGVQVEDRLPRRLPAVSASMHELEQIFLNLLINALDAMPDGGTLTLLANTSGGNSMESPNCISIVVEDTGTGIPSNVRDRVFEPFYTTKPVGRGTGLGLSICEGLIKSYGGYIQIESQENIGTRVIVHVPLAEEELRYG